MAALSLVELLPVLGLLFVLFALGLGLIIFHRHNQRSQSEESSRRGTSISDETEAPAARPGMRRRRGGLARMRRAVAADEDEDEITPVIDEDEDIDEITEVNATGGRVKKKKQANRDAKRRAREEREAALQELREREAKEDEERERLKEEERAKEAEELERLRAEAEAKERAAEEEYNQWKGQISVEDAGEDADRVNNEDPELLSQFCEYVRSTKIVQLEELAAEFGMQTEDAINRLTVLEENGTLTGFFDDRGKFIYVSIDEMKAVAEFIKKRGRVSIQELCAESTRILHLDEKAVA